MARPTVGREKIKISPLFPVPAGAEKAFDTEDEIMDRLEEVWADGTALDNTIIPVPTDFTIVSQTVRRAADGTMVVDVVANTTDIEGISKIEIRITPA